MCVKSGVTFFCQCHEDNDGTLDKVGEAEIKRRVLLESSAAAIITFAAELCRGATVAHRLVSRMSYLMGLMFLKQLNKCL